MIKAIIFDLDRCILNPKSLDVDILDPVLAPLYASNVSAELKQKMSEVLWHTAFEDAVVLYGVPADIAQRMRVECRRLEIPAGKEIYSYGDESYIPALPVKKFLVTSGFRNFQTSKITKLGIAGMFDGIFIDESDDLTIRKKKKKIFEEILGANDLQKEEVLVVGDNPISELKAAKELGIVAIQTLRPGVQKWDQADYHVTSLSELAELIK